MALYSVRLDEASGEALAAAARAGKVSRAVILREAIAEYAGAALRSASPFERMSSLIGVIHQGPGNLSEQTGRGFTRLLERRRTKDAGLSTRATKRRSKRAGS